MGSEHGVVYFGMKLPVQPEAVAELEKETHPLQLSARQFGLDSDWGDCWLEGKDYAVFIGKELGRIGVEYEWNQEIGGTELRQLMEQTQALLNTAGFTEEPKLHLHFVPDI